MTVIHAQTAGQNVILTRNDLNALVDLARKSDKVQVQFNEADWTTDNLMQLAENGASFEFWSEQGEDIYSLNDGEPL